MAAPATPENYTSLTDVTRVSPPGSQIAIASNWFR